MNLEEFNSAIDSIVIDPRERLKAVARRIVERILRDVPQDIADQISASRLHALAARAADLLERGLWDRVDSAVSDFAADLDEALAFERRVGRLKPITPESEHARTAGELGRRLWNAWEQKNSFAMMVEGEQVLEIGWRTIRTTQRTIVRHDPGWDQFRSVTNSRAWFAARSTPEEKIREAEEQERREAADRARPFSDFAGPMGHPAGAEPR